jgi:hypothetical protein
MNLFALGASLLWPLLYLTVLLVARIVTRRAWAAWVLFAVVMAGMMFGFYRQWAPGVIGSAVLLAEVAVCSVLFTWLLWRHGALGLTVAFFMSSGACWTLDMSRWYAWQGPIAGAIIMALAVWGFWNVLGRQSAFPSGALDG